MRVGLFVRTDQQSKPGGDMIQASAYVQALGARGVDARILSGVAELATVDILHVFNIDRPWDCLAMVRAAHRRGLSVVLSPIAHPREALLRYQATRSFWWERGLIRLGFGGDTSERLKALARAMTNANSAAAGMALRSSAARAKRALWQLTSGIQLLSLAEKKELIRQGFDFGHKDSCIVRNGVSAPTLKADVPSAALAEFATRFPRFGVVGGRIEPRKNQLEILRVASELQIPTVFAGTQNLRHRNYCKDFLREIAGCANMLYLGSISRNDFAHLLTQSEMHISASLFEVSPLVDLEARAIGRRVVATASSFGVEFLDEFATICDPWSRGSIRAAMIATWEATGPVTRLPVPAWDEAAEPLRELYERSLEHRKENRYV